MKFRTLCYLLITLLGYQSHAQTVVDEDFIAEYEKVNPVDQRVMLDGIAAPSESLSALHNGFYYYIHANLAFAEYDMERAVEYAYGSQPYLLELEQYEYLAESNIIIGQAYVEQGNGNAALEAYLRGLEYAKEHELAATELTIYGLLADMYYYYVDFASAREYISRASKLLEEMPPNAYYECLIRLYEYATDTTGVDNTPAVEPCLDTLLDADDIENYIWGNLLVVDKKTKLGLWEDARLRNTKILALAQESGYKMYERMAEQNRANIMIAQDSLQEALALLSDLNVHKSNYVSDKGNTALMLSQAFGTSGRYDSAYHYLLEYQEITDFYKQRTRSKSLADISLRFKNKEQQQHLEDEKRKRQRTRIAWLWAFAGLIALGGFAFIYLWRDKKLKEQILSLELENEQIEKKKLEELADMKTTFFNNVSHELRTPLTLVIAPLEDAAQNVKNVDLKRDIDLALSNSKRLLALTNEILDLSKLELTQNELVFSPIELSAFLKRVYHAFDSLAKSRNVTLEDNLEAIGELWVESDPNMLEKIITNLVGNAIKYSIASGKVFLDVNKELIEEGALTFTVVDNGTGINVDDQERIFDRYYQSTEHKNYGGTGIGLALTKQLVTTLGGTIDLKSALGEGSEFMVSIPMDIVTPAADDWVSSSQTTEEYTEPPAIMLDNEKPSILVVEDDREMSAYLSGLLGQYRVDTAPNGQEALKMIAQNHYDLISSDIMMPEMDGFELRERIDKIDKFRHIPYIMLTARVLEEDKLRGFRLGVDDYITKPFNPAEYKARVYNLLKNKEARLSIQQDDSHEQDKTTDQSIAEAARNLILESIDQPEYKVEDLAQSLNYSPRQLSRVLQNETGLNTVNFILEIRLQRAYQLIKDKTFSSIKEVRYEVGISSPSYFSRKFKARFGINASELMDGR